MRSHINPFHATDKEEEERRQSSLHTMDGDWEIWSIVACRKSTLAEFEMLSHSVCSWSPLCSNCLPSRWSPFNFNTHHLPLFKSRLVKFDLILFKCHSLGLSLYHSLSFQVTIHFTEVIFRFKTPYALYMGEISISAHLWYHDTFKIQNH